MRLACCISASLLLAACSEPSPPRPPPAPSTAYYQDYVVTGQPPGFKLQNQIDPMRADPKRFFWRATYDGDGRIVALDTYAPPMCLQSQLKLTYAVKQAGKEPAPVKRQRLPAKDCKPAKAF
jgi:hypothetical protein